MASRIAAATGSRSTVPPSGAAAVPDGEKRAGQEGTGRGIKTRDDAGLDCHLRCKRPLTPSHISALLKYLHYHITQTPPVNKSITPRSGSNPLINTPTGHYAPARQLFLARSGESGGGAKKPQTARELGGRRPLRIVTSFWKGPHLPLVYFHHIFSASPRTSPEPQSIFSILRRFSSSRKIIPTRSAAFSAASHHINDPSYTR